MCNSQMHLFNELTSNFSPQITLQCLKTIMFHVWCLILPPRTSPVLLWIFLNNSFNSKKWGLSFFNHSLLFSIWGEKVFYYSSEILWKIFLLFPMTLILVLVISDVALNGSLQPGLQTFTLVSLNPFENGNFIVCYCGSFLPSRFYVIIKHEGRAPVWFYCFIFLLIILKVLVTCLGL